VAVVGAILEHYGYLQSRGAAVVQPESALWAIRLIMAWVPAGITVLGMVALGFYGLDERRLNESK
jgi:GPH family glycoside/pentoside/hexuronide:cation symporter